eukprot:3237231-Alexandrium_andersonii.AAC.1
MAGRKRGTQSFTWGEARARNAVMSMLGHRQGAHRVTCRGACKEHWGTWSGTCWGARAGNRVKDMLGPHAEGAEWHMFGRVPKRQEGSARGRALRHTL